MNVNDEDYQEKNETCLIMPLAPYCCWSITPSILFFWGSPFFSFFSFFDFLSRFTLDFFFPFCFFEGEGEESSSELSKSELRCFRFRDLGDEARGEDFLERGDDFLLWGDDSDWLARGEDELKQRYEVRRDGSNQRWWDLLPTTSSSSEPTVTHYFEIKRIKSSLS